VRSSQAWVVFPVSPCSAASGLQIRLQNSRCEDRASSTSVSGIRTVDVLLVYGEH
jgi:hypothetical protein